MRPFELKEMSDDAPFATAPDLQQITRQPANLTQVPQEKELFVLNVIQTRVNTGILTTDKLSNEHLYDMMKKEGV
jgi:hypothetical protein